MALDNLRIIRLEAENVKRLVAVDIKPNGDLVEITGKNGHGKTSVLDAILWAMAGEREIQWKPIRDGEAKARIQLSLGDQQGDLQLVVTRTFNAQEGGDFTTALKVVNADGFQPKGAQTLLNTIVGALSFDPGEFVRAKPADQIAILKDVISQLDPDADFSSLEAERKRLFDDRTDVNREEKRARQQALGHVYDDGTPAEPVDTGDLTEQLRLSGELQREYFRLENDRIAENRRLVEGFDAVREARQEVARLRAEADALEVEAAEKETALIAAKLELDSAPELKKAPDTSELSAALESARGINDQVAIRKRREAGIAEADALVKKSEDLTAAIGDLDVRLRALVTDADLPVSGLEIGSESVLLRGVPFNQASDAEQLRASMAIGMAANPRLKVIRVRDGSLLDEDALAVVREVAASTGFQIWMERVGSGSGDAIVMENGNVRS